MSDRDWLWDTVLDDRLLLMAGFKLCTCCEEYQSVKNFRRRGLNNPAPFFRCRACCRKYNARNSHKYKEQKSISGKKTRAAVRIEVLTHYSTNLEPECACCHEDHLEFLALDHIHGGGHKHKQEVRHIHAWAKKNNYPPMFRVLCHNCNQSLGAYGYCPHQTQTNQRLVT